MAAKRGKTPQEKLEFDQIKKRLSNTSVFWHLVSSHYCPPSISGQSTRTPGGFAIRYGHGPIGQFLPQQIGEVRKRLPALAEFMNRANERQFPFFPAYPHHEKEPAWYSGEPYLSQLSDGTITANYLAFDPRQFGVFGVRPGTRTLFTIALPTTQIDENVLEDIVLATAKYPEAIKDVFQELHMEMAPTAVPYVQTPTGWQHDPEFTILHALHDAEVDSTKLNTAHKRFNSAFYGWQSIQELLHSVTGRQIKIEDENAFLTHLTTSKHYTHGLLGSFRARFGVHGGGSKLRAAYNAIPRRLDILVSSEFEDGRFRLAWPDPNARLKAPEYKARIVITDHEKDTALTLTYPEQGDGRNGGHVDYTIIMPPNHRDFVLPYVRDDPTIIIRAMKLLFPWADRSADHNQRIVMDPDPAWFNALKIKPAQEEVIEIKVVAASGQASPKLHPLAHQLADTSKYTHAVRTVAEFKHIQDSPFNHTFLIRGPDGECANDNIDSAHPAIATELRRAAELHFRYFYSGLSEEHRLSRQFAGSPFITTLNDDPNMIALGYAAVDRRVDTRAGNYTLYLALVDKRITPQRELADIIRAAALQPALIPQTLGLVFGGQGGITPPTCWKVDPDYTAARLLGPATDNEYEERRAFALPEFIALHAPSEKTPVTLEKLTNEMLVTFLSTTQHTADALLGSFPERFSDIREVHPTYRFLRAYNASKKIKQLFENQVEEEPSLFTAKELTEAANGKRQPYRLRLHGKNTDHGYLIAASYIDPQAQSRRKETTYLFLLRDAIKAEALPLLIAKRELLVDMIASGYPYAVERTGHALALDTTYKHTFEQIAKPRAKQTSGRISAYTPDQHGRDARQETSIEDNGESQVLTTLFPRVETDLERITNGKLSVSPQQKKALDTLRGDYRRRTKDESATGDGGMLYDINANTIEAMNTIAPLYPDLPLLETAAKLQTIIDAALATQKTQAELERARKESKELRAKLDALQKSGTLPALEAIAEQLPEAGELTSVIRKDLIDQARKISDYEKIPHYLAHPETTPEYLRPLIATITQRISAAEAKYGEKSSEVTAGAKSETARAEERAKHAEKLLNELRREHDKLRVTYEGNTERAAKSYGALEDQLAAAKTDLGRIQKERDQLKEAFESALNDYDDLAKQVRQALEE